MNIVDTTDPRINELLSELDMYMFAGIVALTATNADKSTELLKKWSELRSLIRDVQSPHRMPRFMKAPGRKSGGFTPPTKPANPGRAYFDTEENQ